MVQCLLVTPHVLWSKVRHRPVPYPQPRMKMPLRHSSPKIGHPPCDLNPRRKPSHDPCSSRVVLQWLPARRGRRTPQCPYWVNILGKSPTGGPPWLLLGMRVPIPLHRRVPLCESRRAVRAPSGGMWIAVRGTSATMVVSGTSSQVQTRVHLYLEITIISQAVVLAISLTCSREETSHHRRNTARRCS